MSVVPWEILSNEIVSRRACASAQASFRHFSDKFSSVCGTDASSLTMYATDTALVRLRGETICLPEPLLALSSNAKESCHKLPADTRTGSFLFESRRLIRLRSVVYIIYFAFVPQLKLKACPLVGTTSNSNITAPLIKVDPISYHISTNIPRGRLHLTRPRRLRPAPPAGVVRIFTYLLSHDLCGRTQQVVLVLCEEHESETSK